MTRTRTHTIMCWS